MRKNQQARLKSSLKRPRKGECYATPSAKSQQYYDTAQTRLEARYRATLAIYNTSDRWRQPYCYHPQLPNPRYHLGEFKDDSSHYTLFPPKKISQRKSPGIKPEFESGETISKPPTFNISHS